MKPTVKYQSVQEWAKAKEEEKYKVHTAMRYLNPQGGFVHRLGELLAKADISNMYKIKETWPELWDRYVELYDKMQGQIEAAVDAAGEV